MNINSINNINYTNFRGITTKAMQAYVEENNIDVIKDKEELLRLQKFAKSQLENSMFHVDYNPNADGYEIVTLYKNPAEYRPNISEVLRTYSTYDSDYCFDTLEDACDEANKLYKAYSVQKDGIDYHDVLKYTV